MSGRARIAPELVALVARETTSTADSAKQLRALLGVLRVAKRMQTRLHILDEAVNRADLGRALARLERAGGGKK